MTIKASVLAHSVATNTGKKIATFLLTYPRFIHAELMTHRVFSRNASSSRAIPFKRLIRMIRSDPAMPIHWGANQAGMQAKAQLNGWKLWAVKKIWIMAMWVMTSIAYLAHWCGLHKQVINRLIEPWSHITVVVTATEWNNWFALRDHPDAQPEIAELAYLMRVALEASTPVPLAPGEWHLPFITQADRKEAYYGPSQTIDWNLLCKLSTARCARTSYLTHDGRGSSHEQDIALHDKLVVSTPLHASPAEHQATPDTQVGPDMVEPRPRWEHGWQHGNLSGWRQYRKMLPNEFVPG